MFIFELLLNESYHVFFKIMFGFRDVERRNIWLCNYGLPNASNGSIWNHKKNTKLVYTIHIVAFNADIISRERIKFIDAVIYDHTAKPFKVTELSFLLDLSIS